MSLSTGIQGKTNSRGFTAIEITAVATIIAILAMLIIPLLTERVDKARETAARNDLKELTNVQMLARADTGKYFRLQDLDNTPEFNPLDYDLFLDIYLPHCEWNRELDPNQREQLAEMWQGPYISFGNSEFVSNVFEDMPELFWGTWRTWPLASPSPQPPAGGPFFLSTKDFDRNLTPPWPATKDRMPLDPWGHPYIFFGDGKILDSGDLPMPPGSVPPAITAAGAETDFKARVIYSLGPDGSPGDLRPRNSRNFFRELGIIGPQNDPSGENDDLEIIF